MIWTTLVGVSQALRLRNLTRTVTSWLKRRWVTLPIVGLLAGIPVAATAEPRTITNDWCFQIRDPCESSPAIAKDGTIYVGIWNGDLRAFRPDGTCTWVFHTGREIKGAASIGPDGTVYFGSRDRKLYAVGPDGKQKWTFKTGAWIDSSPAIGVDATIFFGSWDKNLYALTPAGSCRWQFHTGAEIVSSPCIGADGKIYFGSHDRNFYALSPEGQRVWAFGTGGPILSSAAIDKDGTMYFTSVDGFFYALNPDGGLKWHLKTGGITASSPVIDEQGNLCVGVNTKVWIVSRQGAKQRELAISPGYIETSPVALADGSICFVSGYGYLVDYSSEGQCNWMFYAGNGSFTSSPSSRGVIYTVKRLLGDGDFLCALPTDVPLAHSPWPKFCRTLDNTSRSQAQ